MDLLAREVVVRETDIVQDDEGSVDTTDGVVADPRRHSVRGRISRVAHDVIGKCSDMFLGDDLSMRCSRPARGVGLESRGVT